MEESKLTMMQRKSIQEAINRGDSLPPPTPISKREKEVDEIQVMHNIKIKFFSINKILYSTMNYLKKKRSNTRLCGKEDRKRWSWVAVLMKESNIDAQHLYVREKSIVAIMWKLYLQDRLEHAIIIALLKSKIFFFHHRNLIIFQLILIANKEKQKRHLACMMAYGKEMPPTPREPRILHRARRQPLVKDGDPFKERECQLWNNSRCTSRE